MRREARRPTQHTGVFDIPPGKPGIFDEPVGFRELYPTHRRRPQFEMPVGEWLREQKKRGGTK
jgi:hypothetical protein